MQIREIMSQDVASCTPDTPLTQVAQMMIDRDCGAIPVVDDIDTRRVIGMVTDRDITVRMVAQGINPCDRTAADCMSAPALTLPLEASLEQAQQELEAHQLRRMPVIDSANGVCCGIITQADIARYAPSDRSAEILTRVSQPAPTVGEVQDRLENDLP